MGISRQTLQLAIDRLRSEGLVESRRGFGWFVRERPVIVRLARNRLARSERAAGRSFFLTDAATPGWTPDVVTAVSVERATSDVALELQIEEGHEVFVRDRTMRADGQVAQLATSYLPRELTAGTQIEEVNSGPGGIYARLEEAGHTLTGYVERVSVRIATAQEEDAFGLRRGDSVIHLTRIAIAERPVEVNFVRMPAVRFELVYELPTQ